MADQPISNLNGGVQTTTVAATDLLATVDVSDTTQAPTGTTKPIAMSKLTTFFNGALSFLTTVPSGVCGISDSSGVITFYADLNTAITAATSGEVVTLYADITEATNVSVDLKTGVNINLNGYTYTLSQVGTASSFGDNALAVECSLYNGTILRVGGSDSTANSVALFLDNPLSVVTLNGVHLSCDFCAAIIEGELIGGTIGSDGGTNAVYCNGGTMKNTFYSGFGRLHLDGASKGYNIKAFSTNASGIIVRGTSELYDSTGDSSSSYGIEGASGANVKIYKCRGNSSAGSGIRTNSATAELNDCLGFSSSFYGIEAKGIARNCIGISTASLGMYADVCDLYGCEMYSSAERGMSTNGAQKIVKCIAKSTSNNAAHHAYSFNSSNTEFVDCYGEVANVGAYCIDSQGSLNAYVLNCTGKGMTVLLDTSLTNLQTNPAAYDTRGNTIVG